MAGSVNKAIIIGHLGKDPEVKTFANGGKLVSFSVATSESWKNKEGERQERTQWHNVSILNEGIAGVAEKYLKKGSKVFIEGQIETRKYQDKDGQDRYVTDIVLRPYKGDLTLLDSKTGEEGKRTSSYDAQAPVGGSVHSSKPAQNFAGMDEEIPFMRITSLA